MSVRIPLVNRKGEVVAYALVDDADDTLTQWRWRMSEGYAVRTLARGKVYMHRQLLGIAPGDPIMADHRNRDRLDNRRANLRRATRAQQQQNLTSWGASRFRGVCRHADGERWRAEVRIGGKRYYLGAFDSETEAAEAADALRLELMPFALSDPALVEWRRR